MVTMTSYFYKDNNGQDFKIFGEEDHQSYFANIQIAHACNPH